MEENMCIFLCTKDGAKLVSYCLNARPIPLHSTHPVALAQVEIVTTRVSEEPLQ